MSSQILELVQDHRPLIQHTIETLPARLRAEEKLPTRAEALDEAHFGNTEKGRRRLAFDELLLTQLAFLTRRLARRDHTRSLPLTEKRTITAAWTDSLPFTLTEDQAKALATIDEDLADDRPMQRLLMGEVGSGKTVVAVYAMLRAVEHGAQACLMAPTETLAEQHFATLQRLLPDALTSAALLTGATPQSRRRDLLAKLASGELQLLVGTHALIEEPVEFDRLAVAVVDEQHRFGVNQRRALDAKGPGALTPHVLHMTATPIPRTQALTAYGDLDTTTLHELPAGRKPITTHVANTQAERDRAYARIEEELDRGQQAFVVCPLVEASEALEARAATEEYERLKRDVFPDRRLVLLHGRMTPREKQEAMLAFAAGGADVLVATTVIEVGIDVPNATVMLVEDAERFGISQLHQLRGRVGRGEHASLCLLFGSKESKRLQALAEHADGFRLAEIDLELRGEGELIGVRQSGLGSFRFAQLPEDAALLARARHHAQALVADLADAPAAGGGARGALRGRDPPAHRGVRVIAGAHKGRRLQAPPGARPTADRVKEALFSILGAEVVDARVLDLFAGSGALGIEALSRGAASATFVDRDARAVAAVRKNLPEADAVRAEAAGFLRNRAAQYDLVFLDPPYELAQGIGRELSQAVATVLAPAGLVVSESDRRSPLDLPDLVLTDERRYGDTLIRLHRHAD